VKQLRNVRIRSEVTVKVWGIHVVSPEEEKERHNLFDQISDHTLSGVTYFSHATLCYCEVVGPGCCPVSVCVCPSVTNRYCIETTLEIEPWLPLTGPALL